MSEQSNSGPSEPPDSSQSSNEHEDSAFREEPTLSGLSKDGSSTHESGYDFNVDSEISVEDPEDQKDPQGSLAAGDPLAELPRKLGDYALKEMIGKGGMGRVFLAEHTRMQRVVALKMLPVELMKEQRALDRFYDEIRAASRVLHPNIVAAFDAGEDQGINYLAMEFVDGMTLTRVIAKSGPMTVGEAAGTIRQAAMGLLHAHRAGIIHRDVKPGNLMRSADGTIKVLDLGLARVSSAGIAVENLGISDATMPNTLHSTSTDMHQSGTPSPNKGRLIGTLSFMSPEQLEDPDSADSRSDIYSLGATMYFLLTASPPYVGEYLDQVYGHRYGEVPDLMQARRDVDLQFANIFRRMMAKNPDERYASLDEVIEDLEEYADQGSEPKWLAEFASRQTLGEASTFGGGSTTGTIANVMAIDLGMFYAATAEASPIGEITSLCAGGNDRMLFRMAVASDKGKLIFGEQAMSVRTDPTKQLVYCLPMYLGKDFVEREIAGRQCPPEVLLAILIRKLTKNAWKPEGQPAAVAITVPSSYDQLHRNSILLAAQMAGCRSVRLVDRSLAAVQSLHANEFSSQPNDPNTKRELLRRTSANDETDTETKAAEKILFVGLTGQATDVALFQDDGQRLKQLATAGHWLTGTLPWLQRLVELTAETFVLKHGRDPRNTDQGSSLQAACERAMNALMLLPEAAITVESNATKFSVTISRSDWLVRCADLVKRIRSAIKAACRKASISRKQPDLIVMTGPLLRLSEVRSEVLRSLRDDIAVKTVDRADIARGAAACLACELPGRGSLTVPPQSITSQTIGIVVEDAKKRRRILPIIPSGTALPARTNRRLNVGKGRDTMSISLVESSGLDRQDWQALGRHEFDVVDASSGRETRTRMIGFEVNVNGMLVIRAQSPGTSGSTKLVTLPKPMLSEEEVSNWRSWIDKFDWS